VSGNRGATLLEIAIATLAATMIILAVGSAMTQIQRNFSSETDRLEMQQNGRALLDMISLYGRSAGADRDNVFSSAPYSTTSVLPIPQASPTMVRFRADYDENGALLNTFPEDFTVSWNNVTRVVTAGPVTIANVNNFLIRYYNSAGAELTPPMGGWDVSTTAAHGDIVSAIARMSVQLVLESRYRNPANNQFSLQTLTSDITVRNQLLAF
jgi:Tfp pilus assembly protein PilW